MRPSARLLVLLLALGLLLAGCRTTTSTQTVTIGLVAPFEGTQRDLGYEVLAAVKIAVAEQNAAGGWQGRPVTLTALNDEDDPQQAVVQARKLALDPSVAGVVGHWSPETTAAALPVYRDAGIPLAIPVAGPRGSLYRQAIQVAPSDDGLAQALVAFLQARPDLRRVMVRSSAGESAQAAVAAGALAGAGYQVVSSAESADAAVLALDAEEIARFLRAPHPPLVILLNSPYLPLLDRLQRLDESVLAWTVQPETAPAGAFSDAFQAAAGHLPSPQAWLAYDAARRLLTGAAGQGEPPRFVPARQLLSAAR